MSVIFCYKQQPQPWMYYITPDKITFSGDCCPALVTDLTHLLPFQVISQGAFQKLEYRLYGETAWTELTITYSEVMIEGFYFISYNGTSVTALPCGVYEFRLTAGEVWWFEPIKIEDFTISENTLTVRDELMTPFKISEQIIDTTPLIAPCDMILPFMFRTENATSGTITVYMVDESGAETEITIAVTTGVIDGMTYYWHSEEYLYPFLTCGRYYLKIVDGANTYYSVPFVPECGISDIPDGYKVLRDFNGCVIRNDEGVIEYEEASDFPLPIENGLLYNCYAALDARGIAPIGWHLPTKADLDALILSYGAPALRETGNDHWNFNADGTNASGLTIFGSGYRGHEFVTEDFDLIKDGFHAWAGFLDDWGNTIFFYITDSTSNFVNYGLDYPRYGKAIRCVRDTTEGWMPGEKVIDVDGNEYDTVAITVTDGVINFDQIWMLQNLAVTRYNNGDVIPEVTDVAEWAALTTGALCAYNNDWNNV